MLKALEWVKNKRWTKCIIATDCKLALEEIQHQNNYQTRLTNLLNKCRQRLWQEEDMILTFEGREANKLADALTKEEKGTHKSN